MKLAYLLVTRKRGELGRAGSKGEIERPGHGTMVRPYFFEEGTHMKGAVTHLSGITLLSSGLW